MESFKMLFMLAIAIVGILDYCACDEEYTAEQEKLCSESLRYTPHHTSCLPKNDSCDITRHGLIKMGDRTLILNLHNQLRSDVALGKNTSNGLPPAANMLKLEWDEDLEILAQNWADQCIFDHDCNECRQTTQYRVGQNIYEYWTNDPDDVEEKWSVAFEAWRKEIQFYKQNVNKFTKQGLEQIGHLTQILWARTHRVGCGYVEFPQEKQGVMCRYQIYVCDYGPAGNVLSQPVYIEGPAGSQCPSNAVANEQGLCVLGDEEPNPSPPEGPPLKYCAFLDETNFNCPTLWNEDFKWQNLTEYGGSFYEIVLRGGEETTFSVDETFEVNTSPFQSCFGVQYRKGPNIAGQEAMNKATVEIEMYADGEEPSNFGADLETNLAAYSTLSIHLNKPKAFLFTFTLRFSVPEGAPDQYFNLKSIVHNNGKC